MTRERAFSPNTTGTDDPFSGSVWPFQRRRPMARARMRSLRACPHRIGVAQGLRAGGHPGREAPVETGAVPCGGAVPEAVGELPAAGCASDPVAQCRLLRALPDDPATGECIRRAIMPATSRLSIRQPSCAARIAMITSSALSSRCRKLRTPACAHRTIISSSNRPPMRTWLQCQRRRRLPRCRSVLALSFGLQSTTTSGGVCRDRRSALHIPGAPPTTIKSGWVESSSAIPLRTTATGCTSRTWMGPFSSTVANPLATRHIPCGGIRR